MLVAGIKYRPPEVALVRRPQFNAAAGATTSPIGGGTLATNQAPHHELAMGAIYAGIRALSTESARPHARTPVNCPSDLPHAAYGAENLDFQTLGKRTTSF